MPAVLRQTRWLWITDSAANVDSARADRGGAAWKLSRKYNWPAWQVRDARDQAAPAELAVLT